LSTQKPYGLVTNTSMMIGTQIRRPWRIVNTTGAVLQKASS
jgi:hypothetical protein